MVEHQRKEDACIGPDKAAKRRCPRGNMTFLTGVTPSTRPVNWGAEVIYSDENVVIGIAIIVIAEGFAADTAVRSLQPIDAQFTQLERRVGT